MTNTYDLSKLELIIVDNGSTDPSVTDFIKSYSPECEYRYILNEKNDYPSCLRYAKIQAREIAKGDFFIDSPDDHLFIARVPWIEECISRIKSDSTVGCIVHYAFPRYRFSKENNRMGPDKNNSSFSVSMHKGYSDFHIMSKAAYEKIGTYQHLLGRSAEGEYMERSLRMGYFRNLMMKPVAVCLNDGKFGEGKFGFKLINPINAEEYDTNLSEFMRSRHPAELPYYNEAIIEFCLRNGHIKKKEESDV
jgi:glycosyltransferase involved in cell wall biosynthesis